MRRHRPIRWWFFKTTLLAAIAVFAGIFIGRLSTGQWMATIGVVVGSSMLIGAWRLRLRRPNLPQPAPPGPGDSTLNRLVGDRLDPYQVASDATGAVAGLIHVLAVRQIPTSELATEIVTGWQPQHGIAVIDLVMGVNSGHHETGNRWLADHSPGERWWWAQFEVDLRHAASGTRENALFDITASAATNSTNGTSQ